MNRLHSLLAIGFVALAIVVLHGGQRLPQAPAQAPAEPKVQLEQLQAEVKRLNELLPDQAAVMGHLSYHFSNLWFAARDEHWELADFYLSETRANLRWAARVKPKRKDLEGKETVDIVAIAQAMDNGPLNDLKKAIAAKDKTNFVKLYQDALTGCYGCHKASFKPYLRPQVPEAPETRMINFDPKAKTPQ